MTENYRGCYEYLSAQFEQVGGCEFYRELFPDNEKTGEANRDFSKPNAVYLYSDENRPKNRNMSPGPTSWRARCDCAAPHCPSMHSPAWNIGSWWHNALPEMRPRVIRSTISPRPRSA